MITAKVIQHSYKIHGGVDLVTFELEYPRFIHGELMTHRVFSRNAASSRAIPIETMIGQVLLDPAMPIHWGANQSGMQASKEVEDTLAAKFAWISSATDAVSNAKVLSALGVHKQVVNRVLEPYQTMKTIVTATEFDNFFELRLHEDAQPEIHELAKKMKQALKDSKSLPIYRGEWHVPYVNRVIESDKVRYYSGSEEVSLDDAIKVSASCCAQVSYRLLDDSLEKAKKIYHKLVESRPIHASPFEHQAEAVENNEFYRNFRGWKQHRAFIEEQL